MSYRIYNIYIISYLCEQIYYMISNDICVNGCVWHIVCDFTLSLDPINIVFNQGIYLKKTFILKLQGFNSMFFFLV